MEKWCGKGDKGWIENVEVVESCVQTFASWAPVAPALGTGKFPGAAKTSRMGLAQGLEDHGGVILPGRGKALSTTKVCLLRCTLLSSLLLLLVCNIHETEQNSYCQQIITEKHLAELEELADTQMQQPGRVSFEFINKTQLNNSVCYVKAAFPLLGKILKQTEFKENSSNAKKMQTVRRMYNSIDENIDPCIREEEEEERKLSQMCFEEFTTSPYEMLVLVKQFFQDINQLLQDQETFEKDCSQVYRRTCLGPRKAGSSSGVGTDPDCNCLSPALPSATQPSLSAATHASREVAPASTQVPYNLLHATLADLDTPSQHPSGTDGGSGTEEVLSAGVGDTVSVPSPAMQQTAPADSAETLLDPARTLSLAAVDVSVLRRDGELVDGGTEVVAGHLPHDPTSILLDHPSGLRTNTPAASPSTGSAGSGARIHPGEAPESITQFRYSRMASGMRGRAPGSPGDGARARGWGLSRQQEPEDGRAGPSFDSDFVLSAEQRRKEPAVRKGRQEPLMYIMVASVVAVLLAVGGLLFYKYKSRVLERPLEDGGCDSEDTERRA
ncbi:macrophage colony-stimulating factor 1 isoform X2 [Phaenicophaeus curvirostris]|uniref:macrophage colony-stimulating factor 1 isoform X2 n=1 Tax=Phaenicophaeus curvirostris TaxID=33595 RepID=UPI0037F0FCA9